MKQNKNQNISQTTHIKAHPVRFISFLCGVLILYVVEIIAIWDIKMQNIEYTYDPTAKISH